MTLRLLCSGHFRSLQGTAKKGKPAEKRGRKATGLPHLAVHDVMTAGLQLCVCAVLLADSFRLVVSITQSGLLCSGWDVRGMLTAKNATQVLAFLASMVFLNGTVLSAVDVGARAPDFVLRSLDGKNLRLSEFRSEVVVLNFWSSWCGKCRQAIPSLDDLYQQHRDTGLNVLAVGVEGLVDKSSEFVAELDIHFPILLDKHQQVSRLYDLKRLPLTLVIDRAGNVRYVHKGFTADSGAQIASEVAKLLAE